jgi:hypothetical protein
MAENCENRNDPDLVQAFLMIAVNFIVEENHSNPKKNADLRSLIKFTT